MQYMPTKVFSIWNQLPRFFVTKASPVLATSGTFFRSLAPKSEKEAEEERNFMDYNYARIERDYGVPRKETAELSTLSAHYMFTENSVGANSEALYCLRKAEAKDWGVCSDYAQFAQTVAKEQSPENKLTLRTYFAASDIMIGNQGKKYFEDCWQENSESINFVSKTVESSDHDTVSLCAEVWEDIFASVARQGSNNEAST